MVVRELHQFGIPLGGRLDGDLTQDATGRGVQDGGIRGRIELEFLELHLIRILADWAALVGFNCNASAGGSATVVPIHR